MYIQNKTLLQESYFDAELKLPTAALLTLTCIYTMFNVHYYN